MHKIKKKKKIHVSILRLSAPLLYAQNKKKNNPSVNFKAFCSFTLSAKSKKKIHVSILRLSAPFLYAQNQKKNNPSVNFKAFCSFTLCAKSKKKKKST